MHAEVCVMMNNNGSIYNNFTLRVLHGDIGPTIKVYNIVLSKLFLIVKKGTEQLGISL